MATLSAKLAQVEIVGLPSLYKLGSQCDANAKLVQSFGPGIQVGR